MMRSFFIEVPFEIIEAARVDGAGLVPGDRAGRPAPGPARGRGSRADLLHLLLERVLPRHAADDSAARTTRRSSASFVDGRGQFLAVLSAAATIAALPVIIAGWVAQKQLVRGLSMGAVK